LLKIGGWGEVETLIVVDGGVDLIIRKNKPILGGRVLQAFHFTVGPVDRRALLRLASSCFSEIISSLTLWLVADS
jgi:hypothetical protein